MIDPLSVRAGRELARINLDRRPSAGAGPVVPLHFTGGGKEWYPPPTLADVHRLKKQFVESGRRSRSSSSSATRPPGSTSTRSHAPHRHFRHRGAGAVAEEETGIHVGAACPIQQLIDYVDGRDRPTASRADHGASRVDSPRQLSRRLSGALRGQRRRQHLHDARPCHRGAPFPSDLFTVLATLGTTINIGSQEYEGGKRAFPLIEMPAVEALPSDAVILFFHIPYTRSREYVQTYRIARRPQMSHPIVNAGFRFLLTRAGTSGSGRDAPSSMAGWTP